MSILRLLSTNGFISVNKKIIREIGLEAAVIIGELCSEYEYHLIRGSLTDDGCFFSTVENIESKTSLKEKKQRAVIKELETLGILSTYKRGMPSKRFIKINEEAIYKLLSLSDKELQTGGTSTVKMAELVPSNEATNNNIYNNKINNNNNNTDNKKQSAAKATNRNVKEYDVESDEYKLVELFVKQMQKVNELFKTPSNYNTWCKDMSLILDKDLIKVSDDKNERRKIAQQIIIHSCNKTFYSKNIRSIPKLRSRLDEVWMDLKSDKGYNNFKTNNLEQPSKPINVWTPDQMFMQE